MSRPYKEIVELICWCKTSEAILRFGEQKVIAVAEAEAAFHVSEAATYLRKVHYPNSRIDLSSREKYDTLKTTAEECLSNITLL